MSLDAQFDVSTFGRMILEAAATISNRTYAEVASVLHKECTDDVDVQNCRRLLQGLLHELKALSPRGPGCPPNAHYTAAIEDLWEGRIRLPRTESEWMPFYKKAHINLRNYNARRSFRQAIKNRLKRRSKSNQHECAA